MSRNTKSIGIAYEDQYLKNADLESCTLINPTGVEELASLDVTGATTLGDGVEVTGASSITSSSSATGATDESALSVVETFTGAGGVGWAAKFDLEANVALGAYANGLYGYLAFGASGRITGLASGTVGELVLSAGCTQGTYACFEAEIGLPSGAATGTNTSFFYLSSYGAAKATFDTYGTLFNLAGVTKGSGKFLQDTTSGSTARPVQVIKVITPDGTRYLPVYDTAAIGA